MCLCWGWARVDRPDFDTVNVWCVSRPDDRVKLRLITSDLRFSSASPNLSSDLVHLQEVFLDLKHFVHFTVIRCFSAHEPDVKYFTVTEKRWRKLSSCWNNSAGSSVTTATINLTSSSCIFYISVHLFAFQWGGVSSRSLWEAAAVQPEEVQFLPLRAGSVRPPGSARRDRTHRLRRLCGKGEGETQRDAGRSWDIKQTHRTVCKDRNQRRSHSYDGEQRRNLNFRDSVASRQEGDPLPGAVTLRLPFRLNSSTVTQ